MMESPNPPSLASIAIRLKPVIAKRTGLSLVLLGEPGIGKSWTTQQLLQQATCRTYSLHATQPWANLVQSLPRATRLPLWAGRLLERLEHGEYADPAMIADAVAAKLAALAPIILHVEDLHEAEGEDLVRWQLLAERARRTKGVALLATSRSQPPEPFDAFRVEPLPEEASRALLEQEAGTTLPRDATVWIYQRTRGNPLFTLEYFRYLARLGFLWSDGQRWRWRVPPSHFIPATVEALIEQLIIQARTSDIEKYVLEARALLPLDTSNELWAKVARVSQDELNAATRALQGRGILHKGTFAHPLFKEVILKTMTRQRQRNLSRRAINVLQGEPEQAALFVDDAGLEPAVALALLQRAVQQIEERNPAQAARLLAKAVDYAVGEEKGQLALEAARALNGIDYHLMLTLAETAAVHLDQPDEALDLMANVFALQGKQDEMRQVIERISMSYRESPAWVQRYIELLHYACRLTELIGYWESQPDSTQCDGMTIYYVAWAYVHVGKLAKAAEVVSRPLDQSHLSAEEKAFLLEAQAMICFFQGQYQQAEELYDRCLAHSYAIARQDVANSLRNRAVIRLQLGRYAESLPDLEEALKIYSDIGNSLHYAQTLVMMSYTHVEMGDFEQTERVLLEALEIFGRIKPQPFLVHTLAGLSGLYVQWPSHIHDVLALKYVSESLKAAVDVSDRHCMVVAQYALARAKLATHPAESLDVACSALALATELGNPEAIAAGHYELGFAFKALGQLNEARASFTTALRSADEHGLVVEANKAGLELDFLNRDLESARKRHRWFSERGLLNGVSIAERYFPELAGNDTTQPQELDASLQLQVLGPMQFFHGGKSNVVRGEKRKELLALLLEARMAGRTEVTQLELLEALYPNEPEDIAAGALKQLVFQIRAGFSPSVIARTGNGYALGAVASDAEAFLTSGEPHLWRGVYLQGVTRRDEAVAEALYDALRVKAANLLDANPHEALRLGYILMEAEPYDMAILRLVLQALKSTGNDRVLASIYRNACTRLAEVGERLPTDCQAFLKPAHK
jgi:tetratricopeptide (TPR) repeat protein